jgi:hypothetical protein
LVADTNYVTVSQLNVLRIINGEVVSSNTSDSDSGSVSTTNDNANVVFGVIGKNPDNTDTCNYKKVHNVSLDLHSIAVSDLHNSTGMFTTGTVDAYNVCVDCAQTGIENARACSDDTDMEILTEGAFFILLVMTKRCTVKMLAPILMILIKR